MNYYKNNAVRDDSIIILAFGLFETFYISTFDSNGNRMILTSELKIPFRKPGLKL